MFCVGSHVDTVVAANAANAALFAPLDHIWLVPWVLADEYYTVLRFGAGSGSNAGYVDIGDAGGASQAVRTCFEEGSAQGLQPVEQTQTGIAAGPAGQGLQARLEAAAANGCASWDAITSTLIAAGGADGLVEGDWVCSPYHTQASAVELLPVMRDPFQDTPGSTNTDVWFDAAAGQYELAYFWLDTERTFDTSSKNWRWWGPAGQIEIYGVYLGPFLTELTLDGDGSAGTVACVLGVSSGCFLELTQ